MKATKIVGVAILLLIGVGLLPSTRDAFKWHFASSRDKAQGYAEYLRAWPNGRHAAEARSRYDERSWTDAQTAKTLESYRQYEQTHPAGTHLAEARIRIETLELNQALGAGTPLPVREFLKQYPNSSHADTAQRQLGSLEESAWRRAQQNTNSDFYEQYLRDYPDGKHLDEAKARIMVFEFDSGFGKSVTFTADQMKAFLVSLERETHSVPIPKSLEYYEIVSVGRRVVSKSKVVVDPSPSKRACALKLEAGNLSVNAFYISTDSNAPISRPLFPDKWQPTMTHTGYAGPGLEFDLPSVRQAEFRRFLDAFSIFYSVMDSTSGGTLGYVIPDLLWGSSERGSSHPHNGASFTIQHENREIVVRVDGVTGMPKKPITSYKQALALKTYLHIRGSE
jgi:hypothetical protein